MIEFLGYEFIDLLSRLDAEGKLALEKSEAKADDTASTQDTMRIDLVVTRIWGHLRRLGLSASSSKIQHLNSRLLGANRISFQVLESELSGLRYSILTELRYCKMAFIEPQRATFFEQEALFGQAVKKAFPSAFADIKGAGNCISADLNTAAVFHLMRVVEIGLRALAKHLKVKAKNRLEFEEWNAVIEQIESVIRQERQKPRGKKKTEALEFYHGAMGEFNAFKDVWRNNVMHSRRNYNAFDAGGVYIRVRDFMQRLAGKIREKE